MDPLTILSLAGNIVQFVDFGTKLFKDGRGLYKSALGSLEVHEELELVTSDLRALVSKVRQSLLTIEGVRPLTEDESVQEYSFERICDEAAKIAEEIVDRLDSFKVKGPKHKKWSSLKRAVRIAWTGEELRSLVGRLEAFREALHHRILFSIRQSLDADSIRISARFDCLDEQTRRIMSILLENTQTITHDVTRNVREQISTLTQTLSQLTSRIEGLSEENVSEPMRLDKEVRQKNEVIMGFDMLEVPHDEEIRVRASVNTSILNALYYSSMSDRYEDIVEAYPETFQWIFQNPAADGLSWADFPGWLRSGGDVYWISGKAGSGKSTLMKHILDDDRTRTNLGLWAEEMPLYVATFFFWNGGTSEQKSQSGLLRALLHQVLEQCPDLVPVLFPEEWASHYSAAIKLTTMPEVRWSLLRLMAAFQRLVHQKSIPLKLFFLIDGLDEFAGDQEKVEALALMFRKIASLPSFHVKICLSSRPWVIFKHVFESCPALRLHHLTYNDITQFVTGKLKEKKAFEVLAAQEPVMAPALIDEIVKTADGVFLWVSLVVASMMVGMRNRDDISILQSRLRMLPRELEPLYDHLLSLIEPVYLPWVSRALQIMRTTREYARYPFGTSNKRNDELSLSPTIAQFYFAITEIADPEMLLGLTFEGLVAKCEEIEVHLTARCAGLLEVKHTSDRTDIFSHRIQYLHRTVGEFLETDYHWPKILSHTAKTSFNPNVCMLKAHVLSIWADHYPEYYPASECPIINAGTTKESIIAAVIYTHYDQMRYEAWTFQTMLLDFMDSILSAQPGDGQHWSNEYESFSMRIMSFLEFAMLFDLRTYVKMKLSKIRGEDLAKTASYLLHILLKNCGSTAFSLQMPLPSVEMISLLLSVGADPHWRHLRSTAWQESLVLVRKSDTQSLRLENIAYLRIMNSFVTSRVPTINAVDVDSQRISTWNQLRQSPLKTHPKEAEKLIEELGRRISLDQLKVIDSQYPIVAEDDILVHCHIPLQDWPEYVRWDAAVCIAPMYQRTRYILNLRRNSSATL